MKQFSKLVNEKLKLNNSSKLNVLANMNDIKLNTPYKCFTFYYVNVSKFNFNDLSYDLICDKKPVKDLDITDTIIVHWEQKRIKISNSFKLYYDPQLKSKFLVLFMVGIKKVSCAFVLFENLKDAEKFQKEYENNTSYQNEIKKLWDEFQKIIDRQS